MESLIWETLSTGSSIAKQRKLESIARAVAGQAAIDRGEEPALIDPREAARYAALAKGIKATRDSCGFLLQDALARAAKELAGYEAASVEEDEEDPSEAFLADLGDVDDATKINALKEGIAELIRRGGDLPCSYQESKKPRRAKFLFTSNGDDDNEKDENGDGDRRPRRVNADFEILEDDDDLNARTNIQEGNHVSPPVPLPQERRRKFLSHYDEETFGSLEAASDPS